jgi:hypothetical protein
VRKDQATRVVPAGSLPVLDARSSGVSKPDPYFVSTAGDFVLYHGDAIELLPKIGVESSVDLIFADPLLSFKRRHYLSRGQDGFC